VPEKEERQCFDWTLHTSIAREDFDYPSATDGSRKHAEKGSFGSET
jgi:hypothetical protein